MDTNWYCVCLWYKRDSKHTSNGNNIRTFRFFFLLSLSSLFGMRLYLSFHRNRIHFLWLDQFFYSIRAFWPTFSHITYAQGALHFISSDLVMFLSPYRKNRLIILYSSKIFLERYTFLWLISVFSENFLQIETQHLQKWRQTSVTKTYEWNLELPQSHLNYNDARTKQVLDSFRIARIHQMFYHFYFACIWSMTIIFEVSWKREYADMPS